MSELEKLAANRAARMLNLVKGFNNNDIEKRKSEISKQVLTELLVSILNYQAVNLTGVE